MMEKMGKNLDSQRKLKIGFLSFSPPTYGGAIATRMGSHLTQIGHEAYFVGYGSEADEDYLKKRGIIFHRIKSESGLIESDEYAIWKLANKIIEVHNEKKLDLIHVHYATPYALSAYISREALKQKGEHLPYIVTGHGKDIHTNGYDPNLKEILRFVLSNADAITYVGKGLQTLAEKIPEEGGIGISKKGEHITNFVETDKFYPDDNIKIENYGIPSDAFVIGHSSNFDAIKQSLTFFYLAKELNEKRSLDGIYFLMCGEGGEREELQRNLATEGLKHNFIFTGKLNTKEMRKAYNAMDVSMLPSKNEGCSLSALESMACGTPVITSNVRTLTDLITEDLGFNFEPNDLVGLSELIMVLKKDKSQLIGLKEKLKDYIEKNHSVNLVIKKYIDLYLRILSKNQ